MEKNEYEQREKEYSIQLFGFDPSTLVDEVSECSMEYLSYYLDQIKQKLKTKGNCENDIGLDKKIDSLKQNYVQYFDKKFPTIASFLDKHVFKIPQHVLLQEDLAWDNLRQSAAKTQLTTVQIDIERMYEKYNNCLFKKTYLRQYLEELQQTCTLQDKTIQKEVRMKEKFGLLDCLESSSTLTKPAKQLDSKLSSISRKQGCLKRTLDPGTFTLDKRRRLQADIRRKVDLLKTKQMQ